MLGTSHPHFQAEPTSRRAPKIDQYLRAYLQSKNSLKLDTLALTRAKIKAYLAEHGGEFSRDQAHKLSYFDDIPLLQPAEILLQTVTQNHLHPETSNPIPAALQTYIKKLSYYIPQIKDDPLLKPLADQYQNFLTVYQQHLQAWKLAEGSGDTAAQQQLIQPDAEICGDVVGFYRLSQTDALLMSCSSPYGETVKANESGKHATARIGNASEGLYNKPQPVAEPFITPTTEKTISGLTGGEEVGIVKIRFYCEEMRESEQCKQKFPGDYEQFNRLKAGGMSTAEVFQRAPALKKSLTIPTMKEVIVQISEEIVGIDLHDLLYIHYGFDSFNQILTPRVFANYLLPWMSSQTIADVDTEQSLANCYFDLILQIPDLEQRGQDFLGEFSPEQRKQNISDEEVKKRLVVSLRMLEASLDSHVKKNLIALIRNHPELFQHLYLQEIAFILKSFTRISKLFSKLPAEKEAAFITRLFKEIPVLMNKLDEHDFTELVEKYLGVNPSDGSATNIKAVIKKDAQGQLQSFKLKSFDNDEHQRESISSQTVTSPFVRGVKMSSRTVHRLNEKFIPFRLAAMYRPMPEDIVQRLSADLPELMVLRAASKLVEIDDESARLLILGLVTEQDRMINNTGTPTKKLDVPMEFDPEFLKRYYDVAQAKCNVIASKLKQYKKVTLYDLLHAKSPVLAKVYEHFARRKTQLVFSQTVGSQLPQIKAFLGDKLTPKLERDLPQFYFMALQDVINTKDTLGTLIYQQFETTHFAITGWNELNSRDQKFIEDLLGNELDDVIPDTQETYRQALDKIKSEPSQAEEISTRQLIQKFIGKELNLSQYLQNTPEALWKILIYIADNFDFVYQLPLTDAEVNTLLLDAVLRNQPRVIQLLMRCGADINTCNNKKQNVFHLAIQLNADLETKLAIINTLLHYKKTEYNLFPLTDKDARLILQINDDTELFFIEADANDLEIFNECLALYPFTSDTHSPFMRRVTEPQHVAAMTKTLSEKQREGNKKNKNYYVLNNAARKLFEARIKKRNLDVNHYDQSGKPPVFYVDVMQQGLMDCLLSAGVDLNYPAKGTSLTLLDHKLKETPPQLTKILQLINCGGCADAKELFNFLLTQYRQTKDAAILDAVKTLENQVGEFAWLVTFTGNARTISAQESLPANPLKMVSVKSGPIQVAPAIASQIFDVAGNFKKRENTDGRRDIAFTSQGLVLKKYPEQPTHQLAALELESELSMPGSYVLNPGDLFHYKDKKGEEIPFYVSRDAKLFSNAEAERIAEEFKAKKPEDLLQYLASQGKGLSLYALFDRPVLRVLEQFIDFEAWSNLWVLMFLLNDNDAKFDNFCVVPFVNQQGKIALKILNIDFDHVFSEAMLFDKDGHRTVNVKNIMNDFDFVKRKLPKNIADHLAKIDPKNLLLAWRKRMVALQNAVNKMFTVESRRKLLERSNGIEAIPTNLHLYFPEEFIVKFLEKVQILREFGAEMTIEELLNKGEPELAVIHKASSRNPSYRTPVDRFFGNFQYAYTETVAGTFQTKTGSVLQTTSVSPEQLSRALTASDPEKFGLEHIPAIVQLYEQEQRNLDGAISALQAGNVAPFRGLLQLKSFRQVIKGLEALASVGVVLDKKILTAAYENLKQLQILWLAKQETYTNKELVKVIKGTKTLDTIDLSGCAQIDFAELTKNKDLIKKLEYLRKIIINNLQVKTIRLAFPHLKKLIARFDETNESILESVEIDSQSLRSLELTHHRRLKALTVSGHDLQSLNLDGCTALPSPVIEDLIANNPALLRRPYHVRSPYQIQAQKLIWWCSAYRVVTESNVPLMLEEARLSLTTAVIQDEDLETIQGSTEKIKHVEMASASQLTWRSVVALISQSFYLATLALIDFSEVTTPRTMPENFSLSLPPSDSLAINELVLGPDAEVIVVRDKMLRQQKIELTDNHYKQQVDREIKVKEDKKRQLKTAVLLPSGNAIIADMQGQLYLLNRTQGTLEAITAINKLGAPIIALIYSPLKDILVVIPKTGYMYAYKLDGYKEFAKFGDDKNERTGATFVTDNVFAMGLASGSIQCWELGAQKKQKLAVDSVVAHSKNISAITSAGKRSIATGAIDGTVVIHELKTYDGSDDLQALEKSKVIIAGHEAAVTAMCLLRGEHYLASADFSGEIKIWDIRSGDCVMSWKAHPNKVTCLRLGANGTLYSAGIDGQVKVWRLPLLTFKLEVLGCLDRSTPVSVIGLEKLANTLIIDIPKNQRSKELQQTLLRLVRNQVGKIIHVNETATQDALKLTLTLKPEQEQIAEAILIAIQQRMQHIHAEQLKAARLALAAAPTVARQQDSSSPSAITLSPLAPAPILRSKTASPQGQAASPKASRHVTVDEEKGWTRTHGRFASMNSGGRRSDASFFTKRGTDTHHRTSADGIVREYKGHSPSPTVTPPSSPTPMLAQASSEKNESAESASKRALPTAPSVPSSPTAPRPNTVDDGIRTSKSTPIRIIPNPLSRATIEKAEMPRPRQAESPPLPPLPSLSTSSPSSLTPSSGRSVPFIMGRQRGTPPSPPPKPSQSPLSPIRTPSPARTDSDRQ